MYQSTVTGMTQVGKNSHTLCWWSDCNKKHFTRAMKMYLHVNTMNKMTTKTSRFYLTGILFWSYSSLPVLSPVWKHQRELKHVDPNVKQITHRISEMLRYLSTDSKGKGCWILMLKPIKDSDSKTTYFWNCPVFCRQKLASFQCIWTKFGIRPPHNLRMVMRGFCRGTAQCPSAMGMKFSNSTQSSCIGSSSSMHASSKGNTYSLRAGISNRHSAIATRDVTRGLTKYLHALQFSASYNIIIHCSTDTCVWN